MKRILTLCLVMLLLVCPALAENRVADKAELFSKSELSSITTLCNNISNNYNIDCVVATTNDSRGMEIGQYAADLVDYNHFKENNVILVIAMDVRNYTLVTSGTCMSKLPDSVLEGIYDAMDRDMRNGNYGSAVKTALNRIESAMKGPASSGKTNNAAGAVGRTEEKSSGGSAFLGFLVLIALVWFFGFRPARRRRRTRYYSAPMHGPMYGTTHRPPPPPPRRPMGPGPRPGSGYGSSSSRSYGSGSSRSYGSSSSRSSSFTSSSSGRTHGGGGSHSFGSGSSSHSSSRSSSFSSSSGRSHGGGSKRGF